MAATDLKQSRQAAMQYPTDFPEHLQQPVDKAIADAEGEFLKTKQPLLFIAKVYFAFGRQLCQAVKAGLVTGPGARSQMESFLHTVVLRTYFDKCSDQPIDFAHFEDKMNRQVRASFEWGEYQKHMAQVLSPSQAAPEEAKLVDLEEARANARKAFVLPILREKGMTRSQWASFAGLDPAVVYDYLRGDSSPRPDSRKALAEVIGVKESDLPE